MNSAFFSQVDIIHLFLAATSTPEHCCRFYSLQLLYDWFWRVNHPEGPSSYMECYNVICHVLAYSEMNFVLSWHDHASQRLSWCCKIGSKRYAPLSGQLSQ